MTELMLLSVSLRVYQVECELDESVVVRVAPAVLPWLELPMSIHVINA